MFQIHDELLFIVPTEEAEEVFNFKAIMEDTHGWYIPIIAEIDASNTTWAEKQPMDNIDQIQGDIKMKYKYIIGIDPSGAYYEGKGTTGYCVYMAADKKFIDLGKIQASGHDCAEAYWHAHINFLNSTIFSARGKRKNKDKHTIVVIEDSSMQIKQKVNSRMETSKLLEYYTGDNIPYIMQPAGLVKSRWTDEIMNYKGYLKKKGNRYDVCEHTRDSMRHALHFATFRNGDEEDGE